MILAFSNFANATVYLITIGSKYVRDGSDVGDIVEIFEGDEAPSGPGYENAEIIEIAILSKSDVVSALETRRADIIYDPKLEKEYWHDTDDTGNWYEVITLPKFNLNVSALTIQDKGILASEETPSFQSVAILSSKAVNNISRFETNKSILKPEE